MDPLILLRIKMTFMLKVTGLKQPIINTKQIRPKNKMIKITKCIS